MPLKRKGSSVAAMAQDAVATSTIKPPPPKRRAGRRVGVDTNPDYNSDIMDGKTALRASPDASGREEAVAIEKVNTAMPVKVNGTNGLQKEGDSDSPLSDIGSETLRPSPAKKLKKMPTKSSIAAKKASDEIKAFKAEQAARKAASLKIKKENDEDEWDRRLDPDGDDEAPVEDFDALKKEAARPPPVNSDYLPLPWKGRLGYVSCDSVNLFPTDTLDTGMP
jgi:UV DNA damage endonuclease